MNYKISSSRNAHDVHLFTTFLGAASALDFKVHFLGIIDFQGRVGKEGKKGKNPKPYHVPSSALWS